TDYTVRLMLPNVAPSLAACLLANLNSLPFDYIARQNIAGSHLSEYIMKQLPLLPPTSYQESDVEFICRRVIELSYTSDELRAFASDIWDRAGLPASNSDRDPFVWDEERRVSLRAELDAYYAHLYGLTRDELRYILDPKDVFGDDFPSETFRVLKDREEK